MPETVRAQTATATISGVIQDPSEAVLPGITVTARSISTGRTRSTVTDETGRYSIVNLEPGEYQVRAELSGFQTAVRNGVIATIAGTSVVDIRMQVGAVEQELLVVEQESLIEPAKTEISRLVDSREIESLPNIGRNFVDFVKLSSSVAPGRENVGGGPFKEPDVGVGAAAAPRLAFGGQTELNTMIQVDGADNIQTYTGLPRATPSQEAAREFRVLNSTYLPEYGRALGGFVNIVTKSGSNDPDGSLYYFGMNDKLNARSILNPPDADVLRQNQLGGTIGGPIKKDRTFFFFSYEDQFRAESNRFSQVILDNISALNAVRSRFNLQPEVLGQLRTNDYSQFLYKVDSRVNEKTNVAFRYNILNSQTHNFLGGGGRASAASSTARDNDTGDLALVANVISVLSSRLVNEGRFQWARRRFDFESVLKEPDLEVSNLLITGKSTSDVDYYREKRVQVADNVAYSARGHQIKAGVDINNLRDRARWDLFFPARIIFPSLAALVSFTLASTAGPVNFWWPVLTGATHPGFTVPFRNAVPAEWRDATFHEIHHSAYGFFAQDQWNATSKFVLTYGARYDFETYPSRYIPQKDLNNIQPRLGLAYTYRTGGVLRLGYGIFNDRLVGSVGQLFTAAEWSSRGDPPAAKLLFPNVAPVPGRFRQVTATGPAAPPATITFLTTGKPPLTGVTSLTDNFNARIKTPYSQQASLQISQQVATDFAISASYLWVHASKIPGHGANLNAVQTGVLPSGKPILGGRIFPELGNFHVTDNIGSSTYHGGTLEGQKRFSHGISFHGTYTFSKTMSNVDSMTNLADFPDGPDMRLERALSRQHVGHRFTFAFLAQAPKSASVLRDFRLGSSCRLKAEGRSTCSPDPMPMRTGIRCPTVLACLAETP
ncbi:MAG: hypothetical protein DMG13_12575 [Acidobacteria bacterium]|nr:MAG: hypothetical protein DMG13_12575 [Acidobacteriota bacterium]